MKYKISEEPMKLREYGRNVQMMVDYCRTLPDRDERNALTKDIIRIMSYMNPQVREDQEFMQKLWDHFYHLAEFDIDIDSEFPMPEQDTIFTKPTERPPYLTRRSRYRQYGLNIELMADEALKMEDEEEKMALVTMILNIMKMHLKNGSGEKDSNAEATVCEHLKIITKGKLDYQPEQIKFHKFATVVAGPGGSGNQYQGQPKQQQQQMAKKKNKPNKNPNMMFPNKRK